MDAGPGRPVFGIIALAAAISIAGATQTPADRWTTTFPVEPADFVSTGRNPYFSLEPGTVLVLAHDDEVLRITVLAETWRVAGVETRVVEERETNKGQLVEVSRNYFAIDRRTNGVYYFGEDVDMYERGRVVNHEGSWLAGVDGAAYGLMLPGQPLLGARYHQEVAPGVAMDRAEIVSLSEALTTPAGAFTDVLKIEETTPLEPGVREYKWYARGVGLIQDGDLKRQAAKTAALMPMHQMR